MILVIALLYPFCVCFKSAGAMICGCIQAGKKTPCFASGSYLTMK